MMKHVSAILMAIMLLAQIGIAQHAVVHFTDHGHYDHSQGDHGDHKKNASEDCQICVLTKSLSLGLASEKADLAVHVVAGHAFKKSHDHIVNNHRYALYKPRAPPVFLI